MGAIMDSANRDPEFDLLASIAATLKNDYIREGIADPWLGSPFAWILSGPSSRQKGAIGEQLIAGWCAAKGLDVIRSKNSDADRIIGGRKVEIKFSTLWQSGVYKFQQLRDQDYEYVICLGISPQRANCWAIPKDVIMIHTTPQHAGQRGSDTRWLTFPAERPPEWLSSYGGSLSQAFRVLQGNTISNP